MTVTPVKTLLGLVIISGVLVAAYATMPQAAPSHEFAGLDRNGDGRLSPDEAAVIAGLATHFSKFDRDGNGMLDRDEFSLHAHPGAEEG